MPQREDEAGDDDLAEADLMDMLDPDDLELMEGEGPDA
jgi:hypothetical protein